MTETTSPSLREVNAVAIRTAASNIEPDPKNPRTFFNEAELIELAVSIKTRGLLQPILVRCIAPDRYKIIFGERRWRAFIKANGANAEMPILVCEMTDEEVLQAQIAENEIRIEPSETEQSDAASRVLQDCSGDRAEAIRRLGWTPSKFDRRLALTKLTPAVKIALNERRIKLGHAELLAAVPTVNQDKALATILTSGIDVAATRELLSKITHQLAAAAFDKTECASCDYNSTLQRTLFATAVNDGACTNPSCYQIKTMQAQDAVKAQAVKSAPAVTIPETVAPTEKTALATAPVAASAPVAETTPANNPPAAQKTTPIEPAHKPSAVAPIKATPEPQDERIAIALTSCRHKARSLRESIWRRALAKHLAENPEHAKATLIAAAFDGQLSNLSRTQLPKRAAQLISPDFAGSDAAAQFATVTVLEPAATDRALAAIAASFAIDVPDFNRVAAIAEACNVDIRPIWRVDKSFLDLFTKDELQILAVQCEFVSVIGAKEFSKVAKGKRDDLIKTMLNTPGFDWAGRLPSPMILENERKTAPTPIVAFRSSAAA